MGFNERGDLLVVLVLVELDLGFKMIGVETFVFDPKNIKGHGGGNREGLEYTLRHTNKAVEGQDNKVVMRGVAGIKVGAVAQGVSPPQHADCCTCGPKWHCEPHDACFIHDSCFCEGLGSFPPVKPPPPKQAVKLPYWSEPWYRWYRRDLVRHIYSSYVCSLISHLPPLVQPHFESEAKPDVLYFLSLPHLAVRHP